METALVLRTCSAELKSHEGFQWPDKVGAKVEAPDWKKNPNCGNGLHGWLYGQGDYSCSSYLGSDAKWLVVRVPLADIVMLGGKCKFPSCVVEFIGSKKDATDFLIANDPRALGAAVIGAQVLVGDKQSATAGALGTATAGTLGTATAGTLGTATAGYQGTATAGALGTATAGERGTLEIKWYDYSGDRYRTEIAYTGEDGIEANVAYKLDENHKFVKA